MDKSASQRRELESAPWEQVACPTCNAVIGEQCSIWPMIHVARANLIGIDMKPNVNK